MPLTGVEIIRKAKAPPVNGEPDEVTLFRKLFDAATAGVREGKIESASSIIWLSKVAYNMEKGEQVA